MVPLPTFLALFSPLLVNQVSASGRRRGAAPVGAPTGAKVFCGDNRYADACHQCIWHNGTLNFGLCQGYCVMVGESCIGKPTPAPTGTPPRRRRGSAPVVAPTGAPQPAPPGVSWILFEKHDSWECNTMPGMLSHGVGNRVSFNTGMLDLSSCTAGFWQPSWVTPAKFLESAWNASLLTWAKMTCTDSQSRLNFHSDAACNTPSLASWDFKRRTVSGVLHGHCEEAETSKKYFKASWYGISGEPSIFTPCGNLGFCGPTSVCHAGYTLRPEHCAQWKTDKDGNTVCNFNCASIEAHHTTKHDYSSCKNIKDHYTHSMGCCTMGTTTAMTTTAPAPTKRCGRISAEKYAAMSAKGLVPRVCSAGVPTTSAPPAECCPNDCPVGPTGKALYESFFCMGLTAMVCKKDNVGGPKCGVCSDGAAFPVGGVCIEATWDKRPNPFGGPLYSKKSCELENGKVVDATYTDSGCKNEMSRGYQGSVFLGDPCNCK